MQIIAYICKMNFMILFTCLVRLTLTLMHLPVLLLTLLAAVVDTSASAAYLQVVATNATLLTYIDLDLKRGLLFLRWLAVRLVLRPVGLLARSAAVADALTF